MTPRRQRTAPRVVLIAGIKRSGSTWLFNAVRLMFIAAGCKPYGCWIGDYDRKNPSPVHVVKVHSPRDVKFKYHLVLTSRRNLLDCAHSLVRMGYLENSYDSIRASIEETIDTYWHWRRETACEIPFSAICGRPRDALGDIEKVLHLALPAQALDDIAASLESLQPTSDRHSGPIPYCRHTLLHDKHRAPHGYELMSAECRTRLQVEFAGRLLADR